MLATIVITVTLVFCVIFFLVSWRVKDSATSSFAMYAIGGGALPLYLVLFTDIAGTTGARNFIRHAPAGFSQRGIPIIMGESRGGEKSRAG